MKSVKNIRAIFISRRWYLLMTACTLVFVLAFFFEWLFEAAVVFTGAAFVATIADFCLLFLVKGHVQGKRLLASRFSLGDENRVVLSLTNSFYYRISVKIIEQLPQQFQERNFARHILISPYKQSEINYTLRPLERGVYHFGKLLCYVQSPLGLLQRRWAVAEETTVKVYPSYQQLKKFQLLASSDSVFTGVKKIRRLGHSMEFEKIKSYVPGDDIRTMNWKATARAGSLMVNTYTDTREQQVYALIDKGRCMKMPFDGMTLLDYAINAALSLLNMVLRKHDKAGLISFSSKTEGIVPAEKRTGQLQYIIEMLYKQQTEFKESDYENLATTLHKKISQRSLLLLFTNFETFLSFERQLPYLRQLARRHLLCVVFFQNTLLKEIHEKDAETTEDIYIKTIAERFDFEKKQIVKELHRHGIVALLSTPQELSVDVINKYLELKARHLI